MIMNKTRNALLALTTGLGLGLTSLGASAAGAMSGQLNTQMVLQAGCIISGAPGAGSSARSPSRRMQQRPKSRWHGCLPNSLLSFPSQAHASCTA